jgi:hypothetical protein
MVTRRIKPYLEQVAETRRRVRLRQNFRRNQIFGLLIVAALVCLWTLQHTNPHWIFPPHGWLP